MKALIYSFFILLLNEFIEEFLEELIVLSISSILIKGLSTIIIIGSTQFIKSLIKIIVRRITYKEGFDKMEILQKIKDWLNANKFSLISMIVALFESLTGAGVIDIEFLPEILIGDFNFTALIYYTLSTIIVCIGIGKDGIETVKERLERVLKEKAQKDANNQLKTARKEIKAEEKEKEKIKQQLQKEKEAEEQKARIEKIKQEILKEQEQQEQQVN